MCVLRIPTLRHTSAGGCAGGIITVLWLIADHILQAGSSIAPRTSLSGSMPSHNSHKESINGTVRTKIPQLHRNYIQNICLPCQPARIPTLHCRALFVHSCALFLPQRLCQAHGQPSLRLLSLNDSSAVHTLFLLSATGRVITPRNTPCPQHVSLP